MTTRDDIPPLNRHFRCCLLPTRLARVILSGLRDALCEVESILGEQTAPMMARMFGS
jgi:hypothetical protein